MLATRPRPDPKYFVGSGKAAEIKACADAHEADIVLVDQTLTPSQERNLEKLTNRRVLDRNGLILDIFAQRARSFEGKLQVESEPPGGSTFSFTIRMPVAAVAVPVPDPPAVQ